MGWETRPHYPHAWGGLNIMLSRPIFSGWTIVHSSIVSSGNWKQPVGIMSGSVTSYAATDFDWKSTGAVVLGPD